MDRQAGDRQADRQAGRETGRQADRETGRQTGRDTGRQAGRQAGTKTPLLLLAGFAGLTIWTGSWGWGQATDRQTGRQTGRQAGTKTTLFLLAGFAGLALCTGRWGVGAGDRQADRQGLAIDQALCPRQAFTSTSQAGLVLLHHSPTHTTPPAAIGNRRLISDTK